AEIERELSDHLELDAESLGKAADVPERDARFAAQRRFGNVSAARESVRDVWRWTWLEHLEQDVRHGWRAMGRSPACSVALIATMAIGIGASTTVYTLARAIHTPIPCCRRTNCSGSPMATRAAASIVPSSRPPPSPPCSSARRRSPRSAPTTGRRRYVV